jgi:hypothetical protein
MAAKKIRLTAPSGAAVEVDADKEAELLRRGFTAESTKAPAKKAASSKSKK